MAGQEFADRLVAALSNQSLARIATKRRAACERWARIRDVWCDKSIRVPAVVPSLLEVAWLWVLLWDNAYHEAIKRSMKEQQHA